MNFRKRPFQTVLFLALLLKGDVLPEGMDAFFAGSGFVSGWTIREKPRRYRPENLYEYIDGEAELYLSYDFKELSTVTYAKGSPDDTFMTVDCYDMGSPLNAFGLYASYRYPGYAYDKIGAEGFASDYGLTFFKGRYVVEIKTSDASATCRTAARKLSQIMSEAIPEPPDFPGRTGLMPPANQVPHTLKYFARDMLNQAFLKEGFEAKYDVGDGEATGWIVFFEKENDAAEGFAKLKDFYMQSGSVPVPPAAKTEFALAVKTPYHGYALIEMNGAVLCGVQDLSAPEKGGELMALLKEWTSPQKPEAEGHGSD
jgi:hypothetical protein